MTPEERLPDIPPKRIRVADRHSYGLEFLAIESMRSLVEGLTPMYELTWKGDVYLYCYNRVDKHFHYIDIRVKR